MHNQEDTKLALRKIINELSSEGYLLHDYRMYILPLIYLYWLAKSADRQIEDPLEMSVSLFGNLKSKWERVEVEVAVGRNEDIGDLLSDIFSLIEDSDQRMRGILINPDLNQWKNANDILLYEIVERLSSLPPIVFSVDNSEQLAEACEELSVEEREVHQVRNSGRFFTPTSVGELLTQLANPQSGMHMCDPICGSGSILIEAARYARDRENQIASLCLHVKEKNYEMRMTAAISLLLFQSANPKVLREVFFSSKSIETEEIFEKFDIVISNPPFSVKNWTSRASIHERFEYGNPPKNSADYVFIQRALSMVKASGTAVLIVPHGVLFRAGSEGQIRKRIVQKDLIEAVIGLPNNLFYGTGVPTAVIVFKKVKVKAKRQKIIFIDASREYHPYKGRNKLSVEDIDKIVSTYRQFEETHEYSKVVSKQEISNNDFLLTISRYVATKKVHRVDIEALISKTLSLESSRTDLEESMDECLRTLGLMNKPSE